MTAAALESLRQWALILAPAGCLRAAQVLELLDRDVLRVAELADTDGHLESARRHLDEQKLINLGLAERVAAQSEILSRRACYLHSVPHPCA